MESLALFCLDCGLVCVDGASLSATRVRRVRHHSVLASDRSAIQQHLMAGSRRRTIESSLPNGRGLCAHAQTGMMIQVEADHSPLELAARFPHGLFKSAP